MIPSDTYYELEIMASDLHSTSHTSQSSAHIISPTPHAYCMSTSIPPRLPGHCQACAMHTSNVDHVSKATRVSATQYHGKLYHVHLLDSTGLMIIFSSSLAESHCLATIPFTKYLFVSRAQRNRTLWSVSPQHMVSLYLLMLWTWCNIDLTLPYDLASIILTSILL